MPIRPENKHLYPKNWPEIRAKILDRAKHCCEFCGVKNYSEGVRDRDEDGLFYTVKEVIDLLHDHGTEILGKIIKIVLTIAHLDHDPRNNDDDNLKALCQRCHLRYDAKHHAESRKKNREKNSPQLSLGCEYKS